MLGYFIVYSEAELTFWQCPVDRSDNQHINEQWVDLIYNGCLGRL